MSIKFLSERLVTTSRFSPSEQDDRVAASPTRENEDNQDSSNKIDDLLRVEQEQVKNKSVAEAFVEVQRRRKEVLRGVTEQIHAMENEQEELKSHLALLREKQTLLHGVDESAPETNDLAALRRIKQDVHETHMELLSCRQKKEVEGAMPLAIDSLTVRQLTRVGLALTWPLMVALLAAASLILFGLMAILGV